LILTAVLTDVALMNSLVNEPVGRDVCRCCVQCAGFVPTNANKDSLDALHLQRLVLASFHHAGFLVVDVEAAPSVAIIATAWRFASEYRLFISSESENGYNRYAGHASGGQYSHIIKHFEQHRRIGFNVSQRCDTL